MKKKWTIIMCLLLVLSLCACTPIQETGSAAPEIKVERKAFVEQTYLEASAMDCTEVIKFINDMNETLDDELKITDYEMFYDDATSTVFVTSSVSTLAFKVDEAGGIIFTSCTGPQDTKAIISKSIAKAYNSSFSSDVEQLFASAESARWLNSLNSAYVNSAVSGFTMKDLDMTLTANNPDVPELKKYKGFPTITEALDSFGLMNLENYFESPTLDKFWKDVDTSGMAAELDENAAIGSAIKDNFNGKVIEAPKVGASSTSASSGDTGDDADNEDVESNAPANDASEPTGESSDPNTSSTGIGDLK